MLECQCIDREADINHDSRRWLHHACACLALQLAELLGEVATDQNDTLHGAIRFLRSHSARFLAPDEDAASLAYPPAESAGVNLLSALDLRPEELKLLVLAGLPEQHEGLAEVLAMLSPEKKPWVSVALAAQLFGGAGHLDGIEPEIVNGNAVKFGLLRLEGDKPLYLRHLLLADAIWPVLGGLDVWPQRIVPQQVEAVDWGLDDWFGLPDVQVASDCLSRGEAITLRLSADDRQSALARAAALIRRCGGRVEALRFSEPEPDDLRLGLLHCLARGAVPLLDLPLLEKTVVDIERLAWYPGPIVIACATGQFVETGQRSLLQIDLEKLSLSSLTRMWSKALPEAGVELPAALLASRFPVEPYIAARVARDLERIDAVGDVAAIARQIRVRAGIGNQAGIKLIKPAASWPDLILKQDSVEQLLEAVNRLKHQSRVLQEWGFLKDRHGARGVRMLLAGPPGTGKTLSAEVLANELGVDLLIVDLSQMVSKWIGETEKNLEQAFLCAERTRAVLLFDEADALFAKRTEVSNSHDRYANLETAYLLTRLERFEGLAIMSTNLRGNIDPAFIRRMEFIIDYDEPGREERRLIWECHMPRHAPVAADVNFAELAAVFVVVGGAIRNAVVAAAFNAAAADSAISRAHLMRALQREYQKQGKAFPGSQRRT